MTGRCHYAGLTVRGTGPKITAIRLSEEAPLLTNWHLLMLDYKNFCQRDLVVREALYTF